MSDLLRLKVGNSSYLVKWKPPFKQEWTEDSNVTTSLGNKIPVEDCGIEMSLQSVSEMPFMHTIEENCGIEMSLISISKIGEVYYENIGGTTYKTILMPDGKVWMAENLDYKFDGCGIGGEGSPTTPNAWYYDNDETTYGRDGYNCGLLYNWHAAKYLDDNKTTLLPDEWHVPTTAEWDALANAVGGASTAGTKLKAANVSWATSWGGTDDYGFVVLPAGYYGGSFRSVGSYAYFWTSTEYSSSYAYFRAFNTSSSMFSNDFGKGSGYSLRLVKN